MMNNEQYIQLVEMLKRATAKSLLDWEYDGKDSSFCVPINDCQICLDVYYNSTIKDKSASLKLFNSNGDLFETFRFSSTTNRDEYARLAQLYEVVRDKYYRISESEESIMKGLTDLLSK